MGPCRRARPASEPQATERRRRGSSNQDACRSNCATLQYFEHVIDRSGRQPLTGRNPDLAVEPAIAFRGGLAERHRAPIVFRWTHGFAATDALHHLLGTMAQPAIGHADLVPVVGLYDEAHVERD